MKNIGIFGGKFDPPHLGHQIIIFLALEKFSMDEVWVTPSYSHPFKFKSSCYDIRFRMSDIMIAPWKNTGRVKVCEIEKEIRTKTIYTIDVVTLLKEKNPDSLFTLFIGEDNWKQKEKWKSFNKLEKLCKEIVVVGRGKNNFALSLPDISSSKIIEMIRNKKDPSPLLPKGIWELIKEKNIY